MRPGVFAGSCSARAFWARSKVSLDDWLDRNCDPLGLVADPTSLGRVFSEIVRSDCGHALGSLKYALPRPPPSWRVDVTSKTDGYLGQFRSRWSCGRWFQGRAMIHKWGCRS